ncbi:Gfo/Idh/MocA family protein [Phycisphaerales bacterium AB-hyl4]|uniref:Gfo/Idh/MocA family protein n=1 Tax=Natronomicrosphaera hydrolytica TaxID=3242702 RepID=A0ABV4U2L3_9BACT
MPRHIGIGVIGCGARIRTVLRHTLQGHPELRVVAGCDPRPDSVEALREAFADELTVYDDYHQLVQDPNVQWVFVGSWNIQHHDHILAALGTGCHVFAEKPIATTIDDCLNIYTAQQRTSAMFVIGFTLRYSPHYRRVVDLIRNGAIGEIVSIEANETLPLDHGGFIMADWRRSTMDSGGHMLEKCCHDIDVLNWIVQSRARRVASFGGNTVFRPENEPFLEHMGTNDEQASVYLSRPLHNPANPFSGNHDIVDHQVAIIEFENNVRATFHTNIHSDLAERRTYICGTKGSLRANVLTGSIELRRHGLGHTVEQHGTGTNGGHAVSDVVLGEELANCMLEQTPPATDMEDAVTSAITCLSIDQAMHERTLIDLHPHWKQMAMGRKRVHEQLAHPPAATSPRHAQR